MESPGAPKQSFWRQIPSAPWRPLFSGPTFAIWFWLLDRFTCWDPFELGLRKGFGTIKRLTLDAFSEAKPRKLRHFLTHFGLGYDRRALRRCLWRCKDPDPSQWWVTNLSAGAPASIGQKA